MLRLAYLALLYWWHEGSLCALIMSPFRAQPLEGLEQDPDVEVANEEAVPSSSHTLEVEEKKGEVAPASGSQEQGFSASPGEKSARNAQSTSPTMSSRGAHDKSRGPPFGNELKRAAILAKLTPLTALTSFVADLDLFADWYFLEEGLEDEAALVSDVALAFTIVGTVAYVLITLEFHPVSKAWACWQRKPLSPLQHVKLGWQLLLNVIVEDIPQFAITLATGPRSVAGVLNIGTAVFSLLAKAAEAFATKHDVPMSAQLRMIETDPGIVRHLHLQQQRAEQLAVIAARLTVLVSTCRREQTAGRDQASAAIAFQIMQVDADFMKAELSDVRQLLDVSHLDLSTCSLRGENLLGLGAVLVSPLVDADDCRFSQRPVAIGGVYFHIALKNTAIFP